MLHTLTQKTMSKKAKREIKTIVPSAHGVQKVGTSWVIRDKNCKCVATVSRFKFENLKLNVM